MAHLDAIDQPPPLAKIAFESLRDSILTGRLRAGEVYNEMALAKELGISRTPVREALLELSAKGLVTFLPRRGVMVNRFSVRDVEEVFEVRAAIELAIVEKVVRAWKSLDLRRLEKALAEQERAIERGDKMAFLEADRLFHSTFGEMANNRRLVAILENVRDMIHVMGMEALAREGRPAEVLEEHGRVIEAIKAGKPAEARRTMARHLEKSKESVLEQYRAEGDPSDAAPAKRAG